MTEIPEEKGCSVVPGQAELRLKCKRMHAGYLMEDSLNFR